MKLPNFYIDTRFIDPALRVSVQGYWERSRDTEHLYIPAARLRELVEKQEKLRWSYKTLIEELEALLKEPGE